MSRIRIAFDFNCSPRIPAAMDALYGYRGYEFMHLQSLVQGRARDEMWADIYKRFGGRVVLSGDGRIATRPHEAVAFIDNGLVSFFPEKPFSNLAAHARSAFFVHAWESIEAKLKEDGRPACWRIRCSGNKGEVALADRPLKLLKIPDTVLEQARRATDAGGAG